jgi:hypothetical protein
MSRSRRPAKRPKCICGHSLVPYLEHTRRRWRHGDCPVLEYVHEANQQFLRFKASKAPCIREQTEEE